MNPILIGSGFYASFENHREASRFFHLWQENTQLELHRSSAEIQSIVVVDNSALGLPDYFSNERVRIHRNLGHAGDPFPKIAGTPLLGWSISWIIPALAAYSEGCDFIYKEQDCLAFGDWLPMVRVGRFSIGRNDNMPCEQSLFFIRHDAILEVVRLYLCITDHDAVMSTEEKFVRVMQAVSGAEFHSLTGGRNRPLPDSSKPFYLQRITNDEMQALQRAALL